MPCSIPQITPVPGLFVVVEGIDGSGKSTLVTGLGKALVDHAVLSLCEPTKLASGLLIRRHLTDHSPLPQEAWLEMFGADRRIDLETNINPALARGEIVLLDRYLYSTAAYQGSAGKLNAKEILHSQTNQFRQPDVLIYLDISPEDALARVSATREKLEIFETSHELHRIHSNYEEILQEVAQEQAGPTLIRIAATDSLDMNIAKAEKAIRQALSNSTKRA
ncbi:MAG TPA: dTMP kinase [Leptospiraceae bacterium]|nr:dTMP kinase [Leptospirales bacterium]HMU83075.1 dTMP kinase [Leptospiraceae bacterium]HMW60635.1 dTMP kinase [Leptospiraceae bacterium]HMX56372.1 dTMP kinase [Leptospiraceae bacterium]HMY44457.1 dTMP kinase [Leptospiraceae bacterium]